MISPPPTILNTVMTVTIVIDISPAMQWTESTAPALGTALSEDIAMKVFGGVLI